MHDGRAFSSVDTGSLADGAWHPDEVSSNRNACGAKPRRVLFLWVFDRPSNLRAQVFSHGWAHIGPVYMLLSPAADIMQPVIEDIEQLEARLRNSSVQPERQRLPMLNRNDGAFRRYYGYPVIPMHCTDGIWREAFLGLSRWCSLFVIDITARDPPRGLLFEIEHLFHHVRTEDIVILMDRGRANVDACLALLEDAWTRASGGRRGRPPVFLYDSMTLDYFRRVVMSQLSGRPTIPLAPRVMNART